MRSALVATVGGYGGLFVEKRALRVDFLILSRNLIQLLRKGLLQIVLRPTWTFLAVGESCRPHSPDASFPIDLA